MWKYLSEPMKDTIIVDQVIYLGEELLPINKKKSVKLLHLFSKITQELELTCKDILLSSHHHSHDMAPWLCKMKKKDLNIFSP